MLSDRHWPRPCTCTRGRGARPRGPSALRSWPFSGTALPVRPSLDSSSARRAARGPGTIAPIARRARGALTHGRCRSAVMGATSNQVRRRRS